MKEYRRICPLYHISPTNLDGVVMKPAVPSSAMFDEDSRHVRVCFSTSVMGCIRAFDPYVYKYDMEYYVMTPVNYNILNVFVPSEKEVPEVKTTREKWVRNKVKVKCIGKIRINIKSMIGSYDEYKYRWVEKY